MIPQQAAQVPEAPPLWASQLLAQIEGLSSRIGLIESGAIRPSFSEAASEAGGVPIQTPSTGTTPDTGSLLIPKALKKPVAIKQPAVPMGESGSGYTRLPNGKLVRNKRPAHKPLQQRQASNWRGTATSNLVAYLKQVGLSKDDPKPVTDPAYATLVADLENSKEYFSYVKSGGTDEVQTWRAQVPQYTGDGLISQAIGEMEASQEAEAGFQTGFEDQLRAQNAPRPIVSMPTQAQEQPSAPLQQDAGPSQWTGGPEGPPEYQGSAGGDGWTS